jgi:hypothetical protein
MSPGTDDRFKSAERDSFPESPLRCLRENRKKEPQISPLRYAPVEMTNLLQGWGRFSMEKELSRSHKFVISTGA